MSCRHPYAQGNLQFYQLLRIWKHFVIRPTSKECLYTVRSCAIFFFFYWSAFLTLFFLFDCSSSYSLISRVRVIIQDHFFSFYLLIIFIIIIIIIIIIIGFIWINLLERIKFPSLLQICNSDKVHMSPRCSVNFKNQW